MIKVMFRYLLFILVAAGLAYGGYRVMNQAASKAPTEKKAKVPLPPAGESRAIPGKGVAGSVGGQKIFLGSPQAAAEIAFLSDEHKAIVIGAQAVAQPFEQRAVRCRITVQARKHQGLEVCLGGRHAGYLSSSAVKRAWLQRFVKKSSPTTPNPAALRIPCKGQAQPA